MAQRLLDAIIRFSHRRAWFVLLLNVAVMVAGAVFTVRSFAIDTDNLRLISSDVPWRQREIAIDAAFPSRADLIIAVVDASTPESAEIASHRLAGVLAGDRDHFKSVRQPEGHRFFRDASLLYQTMPELEASLAALIKAQPLLGTLARDPSLRGLATAIELMSQGIEQGAASGDDLAPLASALGETLAGIEAGRPVPLAWSRLASGRPATPADSRRLVLVRPVLDYSDLAPGEAAARRIRELAKANDLTPERGVTVRLTGPVRLADEEFATVAEGAELATGLTALIVFIILWIGHKSLRIVAGVYLNLMVGLAATAAVGLMLVGSFNLISVAFAALFMGLAVDFGIQFSIRYRTHRFEQGELAPALIATSRSVGGSIALAVVATALAFFALVPTEYRGVAELGLIAGIGMFIALATSFTLLPALLTILNPPGEDSDVGFAFLRPVDRLVLRLRWPILLAFAVAAVAALPEIARSRFDADPINLRSARVESVSALKDIAASGHVDPNAIDILTPSLGEADALAVRLASLPEVGRALTLSSFVPQEQPAKLVLIRDAASLLLPTLAPSSFEPLPTDVETVAALTSAAGALRQANGGSERAADPRLSRLADDLERLATATVDRRAQAADALLPGLSVLLDLIRAGLSAHEVSVADVPPEFAQDWITADGRARIEVAPAAAGASTETLIGFANAVEAVAPAAASGAITVRESGRTVTRAFLTALALASLSITVLLIVVLRNLGDVLRTLAPLAATALFTLAICGHYDLPFNFANIIALPLMFGIGVAFSIYYVIDWRAGRDHLLQTSLTRAIVFSALTTLVAFGGLALSPHPGTASMGRLLAISLAVTLACVLIGLPALLGRAPRTSLAADSDQTSMAR